MCFFFIPTESINLTHVWISRQQFVSVSLAESKQDAGFRFGGILDYPGLSAWRAASAEEMSLPHGRLAWAAGAATTKD